MQWGPKIQHLKMKILFHGNSARINIVSRESFPIVENAFVDCVDALIKVYKL